MKLYLDTETIGLCGPVKLIQYSIEREPIKFIKLPAGWMDDPQTVADLYELFIILDSPNVTFVGWNTSFDLWHLYRLKNLLDGSHMPFACKVLDLYGHAVLNGPFAPFAFTKRGNGRAVAMVRRVPRAAAEPMKRRVYERLAQLVPGNVSVHEHAVTDRPDLVTISWGAEVSLSLKSHAEYWGQPIIKLKDVWPLPRREDEKTWYSTPFDTEGRLVEPYASLEPRCDSVLLEQADESEEFFTYARRDIEYLWLAYDKLGGPTPDYNDTATHVVAYTRYHGYDVDPVVNERTSSFYSGELNRICELLAGTDLKSHVQRKTLLQKYNPLIQNTKKQVLEILSRGTDKCAEIAKAMLSFGSMKQKLDQVKKVMEVGRLHADLRVMGTATLRKAGTGAFNVQGIGKIELDAEGNTVGLREAVLTAGVGDFNQFELAVGAAAWGVKSMLDDMDKGIDIHLKVAIRVHPKLAPLNLSYEAAKRAKSDVTDPLHELVTKCRQAVKNKVVFPTFYGAEPPKIAEGLGIDLDAATQVQNKFMAEYPEIKTYKDQVKERFCTADTVHWSRESVSKMADCEEDIFGNRRYWKFEKDVACLMWELANSWENTRIEGTVIRQSHKGPQSIDQACRSACLGAAIAIQQAVYRQAANTRIQMSGAVLCKMLEAELWDTFRIPMLNVHDELVFARCSWFKFSAVTDACKTFVSKYKHLVPHLKFDLSEALRWSEKA
jgi:hypothetical protein